MLYLYGGTYEIGDRPVCIYRTPRFNYTFFKFYGYVVVFVHIFCIVLINIYLTSRND